MGRRRFEMFQYRQVLVRLREGDSERVIARDGLMGREKVAAFRALSRAQGWLELDVPLPEESAIADLCTESRSVAEVAALIRLPLGVVRVLIADLADRGVVRVHAHTSADADSRPDAALLKRVLSGLRNL